MACTVTFTLILFIFLTFSTFITLSTKDKTKESDQKNAWKKKDVRDYTDADIERLYDEWEVSLSLVFATLSEEN